MTSLLRIAVIALLFNVLARCQSTFQPIGASFTSPVAITNGFSAQVVFSNLTLPRGITIDDSGNVLVVERGYGVTAFSPVYGSNSDATGRHNMHNNDITGWERSVVISNPNFTHGIALDGSNLYVSTGSAAILYSYDAGAKNISGGGRILVSSLPADGDLTTHPLLLSADKSQISERPEAGFRAVTSMLLKGPEEMKIRAFSILDPALDGSISMPVSWLSGTLIAYGIRNPAGFAYPPYDTTHLYVLENGASIDNTTGLTPAFVNDNPADEMNLVALSSAAEFYGFPDCTTLWNGTADPSFVSSFVEDPIGYQFSLSLENNGTGGEGRNDSWCQKPANNVPPSLSFQAHSVPLDIKFYTSSLQDDGAFPSSFENDAFVSFHGSFDRIPPTGYGIVHFPLPLEKSQISTHPGYKYIIQTADLTPCPTNCLRAVGLAFGRDGKLFGSSDASGELFVIESTSL